MSDIFLDKVERMRQVLETGKDLADSDLVEALIKSSGELAGQYDSIMNEDRDLKLGIVGRVKAGKSSFLNALLFNGEDLLPKAATPMTAALTRIIHAASPDEQEAVVNYYTKDEWKRFQKEAEEFDTQLEQLVREMLEQQRKRNPLGMGQDAERREQIRQELLANPPAHLESLKSSYELVAMAAKNGIRHGDLPKTGDNIYGVKLNSGDFFTQLRDFVGAEGRCTPFVKDLLLKIHHPDLEGIEIVDTPGLNDPVASRVDKTNTFLKECDAVLLLSCVSRFLDSNDADLAGRKFNEASVKRAYIIGTMADVGLMECPKRNISIEDAYAIGCHSYETQAEEFTRNLEKRNGFLPRGMRREDNPDDATWPLLVSSLFFSIGRKLESGVLLNEEEQHVINRLKKQFFDFDEKLCDSEDFKDLACFAEVRANVYEPVRMEKNTILKERINAFRDEQSRLIKKRLSDILASSERLKKLLENNDREGLMREREALSGKMEMNRRNLEHIFENKIYECKIGVNDLKNNMRQTMSSCDTIKPDKKAESRTWTTGLILKDTHYETYIVRTASTSQATKNLEEYGQKCMRMITSAFNDLFNIDRFSQKLCSVLQSASGHEKMDVIEIQGAVDSLLNKIAIPEVNYDAAQKAKERIFNLFPNNEVRDGDIANLEKVQSVQLSAIYDDYAGQIDKKLNEIINELSKSKETFVDQVQRRIAEIYQNLERQLEDKEKNIRQYNDFIAKIKTLKQDFPET